MRRAYRRNEHGAQTPVAIKGGRLAVAAAPAQVVTLTISDVPGDDLSVIASGPTVPDVSTRADALAVLTKYGIEIRPPLPKHLNDEASETPKPGDPRFSNVTNSLVATPQKSLEAAARVARRCRGVRDPRQRDRGREPATSASSMPALRGNAEIGVSRSKSPACSSPAARPP